MSDEPEDPYPELRPWVNRVILKGRSVRFSVAQFLGPTFWQQVTVNVVSGAILGLVALMTAAALGYSNARDVATVILEAIWLGSTVWLVPRAMTTPTFKRIYRRGGRWNHTLAYSRPLLLLGLLFLIYLAIPWIVSVGATRRP